MAKLQIFIPAYNVGRYIDECLASVSNQTFKDWEALIVDDASTDGLTREICDAWTKKDDRIQVIHLAQNRGLSQVRQYCLNFLNAPYVGFVDSDDTIDPEHFETLVNYLEQYEADVALCSFTMIDEEGKYLFTGDKCKAGTMLEAPLTVMAMIFDGRMHHTMWSQVFRSHLFNHVFFPDRKYYEDYSVSTSIYRNVRRIVHTGACTYNYRTVSTSISRKLTPRHYAERISAAIDNIEVLEKMPQLTKKEKQLLLYYPKRLVYMQSYNLQSLKEGDELNYWQQLSKRELQRNHMYCSPLLSFIKGRIIYRLLVSYSWRTLVHKYPRLWEWKGTTFSMRMQKRIAKWWENQKK